MPGPEQVDFTAVQVEEMFVSQKSEIFLHVTQTKHSEKYLWPARCDNFDFHGRCHDVEFRVVDNPSSETSSRDVNP